MKVVCFAWMGQWGNIRVCMEGWIKETGMLAYILEHRGLLEPCLTTLAKALPGTRVQMAGRKSSVHGGHLLRVQRDSRHPRVCELGCVMVKINVSVKRYRSSTSSGG